MIEAQELADYLDLPVVDVRCELAAAAAVRWVENRRCKTEPAVLWMEPDVRLGALQFAALEYQKKAAPQGFPEYEDFQTSAYGSAMAGIYRLVGLDPVVA